MNKKSTLLYFLGLLFLITACSNNQIEKKPNEASVPDSSSSYKPPTVEQLKASIDELSSKKDPLSKSVVHGYELMNNTHTMLDKYVGNQLSCSSCHGNAGMDATSPFIGVVAVYPQYNPRSGAVLTIEDRINGCFKRSMNGKPIPYDGEDMRAMVAYLKHISAGVPTDIKERPWITKNSLKDLPTANIDNGEKLYKQSCSTCHAVDGSGMGANSGPALWGPNSFNIGAGMARMSTMAGYIKRNMPLGEMGGIKQGTLTDQQAADLAAYILSHDRPDFNEKAKDWPNGDPPKDVPYDTDASKKSKVQQNSYRVPEHMQGAEGETVK